jgi:hypothetical protein
VNESIKEDADKVAVDLIYKFGCGKYTSIIKAVGRKSK